MRGGFCSGAQRRAAVLSNSLSTTPSELNLLVPRYAPTRKTAKPERVAFYIPSLTPDGKKVYGDFDQKRLVEIIRNFLAFEFGGATLAGC